MPRNKSCFFTNNRLNCFKWLLSLLFITTLSTSKAQSELEKGLPFITNYSAKTFQALPQAWSIQEDSNGIMYFGVQNYILEYDGIKWRKIGFTVNSASTVVRAMVKDKNGLIYYSGYGDLGYLTKDSLGQTISKSLLDDIPKANRNFLDIWSAYATGNGIYFQSREYIFRLSDNKPGEKKTVKVWKPQTKFMYSFYVDGNYYVHQQGLGLFKMTNDSLILVPGSEFLGKERMQVMLPYPAGPNNEKQYLIGMFYSGLYIYNGKTFQPFSTKADPIFRSGTLLYKGFQLKNGKYVLSTTGKGLVIIDAAGNLLQKINRDVGLQDESIYSAFQDTKGALWLALDNGISRVEITSPLTKFTLQSGINTGVLTMCRFDGSIYLGTTNGLLRFDSSKQIFEPVSGLPQNQTFNLLPDGNQLLIAGDGLGAIRDKKAVTIRHSISGDLSLTTLHISSKNPNILFGGGQFGVAVFTRDYEGISNNKFSNWHFGGYVPNVPDQIWTFSENENGKIWAGSANGVVYRITPVIDEKGNLDKKKTFVEAFGSAQGLKNGVGTVVSINGKSYFNSDSLLYRFDDQQKRFIPDYTFGKFSNGGASTQFAAREDPQGRVWIRAGKETILATPKPGGGYTIDNSLLNPIADFTIQDFYPEKNGIVWLCTTDGLIRYDQNLQKNFDQSFKTILRHIEAGKQSLNVGETDANQKPVSISYKNSTLRFEYAAPFFEQEEKIQYQTLLEGFEKDWSDFDNNSYKEYTNLPPGEYHFHVRAKNIYNKLSAEAVYSFSIQPPWYRTWWAYLLYALVAIFIIYLFINWKVRQLKAKHAELEKIVEERTSQLSARVEELAVINNVQEGLVSKLDMQSIYDLVGNKIRDAFDAQVVIIGSFDHTNGLEHFNYTIENGKRYYPDARPLDKLRKQLIEIKQKIVIENKEEVFKWFGNKVADEDSKPAKSAVFVPLLIGGKVKRYISLQNVDKDHAFSNSDIRLLETLANSMSVALENARLFDETNRLLKETEQRTAELSVINSVQEGLAKELHMQAIYELVGDKLSEVMHTLDIDIRLFSPETNQVFYPYMRDHGERLDIPPGSLRGMSKHVYETQQTLIINENLAGRMEEFGSTPIPGTQMEKSYMAVPIMVGNKALGMVSMSNYEKENAFSDSDVRLLQTVVSAMSVALENARLFDETTRLLKETEQRTSELAVINSVQEGLVAQMDMQSIYDLVGEKIRNIFQAQIIDIVTYNKKKNLIEDRYAFEKGDRTLLGAREPLGFRKHVIETRQLFLINEDMDGMSKEYESYVTIGEKPKSAVFVPMITGGEVTGIISLQNLDHENAFSESSVNLLTTLANSMSVALKSAGLFDETNRLLKETEQRNAELAVINSVQESLVAKLDMAGIYELVGEKIRQIFGAQVIDIVTYDPAKNVIADQYAYEKGDRTLLGEREPKGFRKHVIKTGTLLLHNENVLRAMREFDNEVLIGDAPKSQIYVPMIADGKVKGIISLQNLDHEHAFSDSDVSLLTTLANSMSVALESARLFDETNRLLKETEQRTSELAVINSVQEGLVAQMDMQAIYDLVGEKIRNIFNAQIIDIVTYDKKKNLIEDKYSFEKGDRSLVAPRKPTGFRKHVIESPHVFLINEKMNEVSREYDSYVTIGELPKSAVFVPMMTGGDITGIISLQNLDHEFAFSDSDVNLLTTLANSMSVALKSAGLFDETNRLLKETEQRNAELAVINSVQESLVGGMDMAGIYELVGEKMREIFKAQVIDIVTFNPERNVITDKYSYEKGDRTLVGERKPTGFRKHVIQTGALLVHNENVADALKEYDNEIIIGETPKSHIYVPMLADGKVKGIISLQNLDHENAFSDSDVSLLTTLTNSMSVALESARLFDETARLLKETEQRNAELAVITSVQESLVAKMDVEAIYYLVGEKIREVFSAQVIDITTYDSATNLIEDKYAYEKGDRTLLGLREPSGFRKHVIDSGQMLVINKDMYKQRLKYENTIVVGKAAKSLVMAPLMAAGKVNGVISLQNLDKENAFSDSEISLLSTLVNSMSVALKSARLFDETTHLLKETEQRTAELGVINSVQEGLANELDMNAIYNLVGDRIQKIFNAQVVIISNFNLPNKTEHFNYAYENGEKIKVGTRPINQSREILIQKKHTIYIKTEKEARDEYDVVAIDETKMPKSLLFVPLLTGNEIKGYVSIQNVDVENAFSDADIRLLETLANSMSVALENARLFDETNRLLKETKERTAELGVINNVQDGLSRELDVQAIYNLVGDRLCELFPETQTLVIRSFNHNNGLENFQYAIEKGKRLTIKPQPFIWANKQLIETKKPIHINKDYIETAKKFGGTGVTTGKPPKSAVFVPMIVGDVVTGSISLQNVDRENAFSESNLRLLTTLTNSMSVALENARLFNETTHLLSDAKQRASELSTVNNVSKALASQLNPTELIQFVGDQLRDLFKANIVYLALFDKKTKVIHFPYQYGDDMMPMKLGEGLTSKIILTGEPLLINKNVQELRSQLGVQRVGIPASSYLGVPIPVGDEIIGVLSVQSTEHENLFNENDQRLLSTIASSVGVALNNAQLFEDVEQAKMEAEKASKVAEKANEAKSAFLSTVSHELRTPLTSVLGFAKIINKRLNDKIFPIVVNGDLKTEKTINQINENLQVVISEGERLTHLINDVLDLAKIEAGRMEWNQENVSLAEVAERAIAATTSLFEQKGIKLAKKIDNNVPDIIGDADKLIQVVINLFSNAAKFTEKGLVTCEVLQKENEVIVSVTDTGIGIAKEDYGAVFEQFKQVGGDTLTDKPKGTGLGLPICKEIVEHHGGRIWVDSKVGKGSTFSFAIPFIPSENKTKKKQKPIHLDELVKQLKEQMAFSKLKVDGKHATILVVDDDDSIRSLLQQELGEAGYLIEQATNGKHALECIRKNRPDLIILDVMMPEMNGFDVAAILKNDPQTMDIPIIILSIIQDKARGFRIGVDRYLTKPIDTAQLFKEVGNLLEQGKSKKKVLVVDEDSEAVRSLTDVLQTKGYQVVESNGKELAQKAIATQPDIIILNSMFSGKQEIVQTLRFEKGLENVLFFIYQ
jgi:GAF domain-containing protein/CheY-like chemotaxis protein